MHVFSLFLLLNLLCFSALIFWVFHLSECFRLVYLGYVYLMNNDQGDHGWIPGG